MDVNTIVARWLSACLHGEMTVKNLADALGDLDTVLPPARAHVRPQLAALKRDVEELAADRGEQVARLESVGAQFLGAHPDRFLESRGAPGWRI